MVRLLLSLAEQGGNQPDSIKDEILNKSRHNIQIVVTIATTSIIAMIIIIIAILPVDIHSESKRIIRHIKSKVCYIELFKEITI